jgi:glycosyltransferase involved in cell wall biosynthesis
LRLIYLTHNVSWKGGGIFFTAYHQARHLVARGHEITIMSISKNRLCRFSESFSNGVRIIETPDLLPGKARSGWDLWDLLRRIGYLSKLKCDLIHGFESRPVVAIPALQYQKRYKIPLVFTWADWFGRNGKGSERGALLGRMMNPIETFCEEHFMPKGYRIIAMGEPLLERALSIGIPRERLSLLLHGCDVSGMMGMTTREARLKLGRFNGSDPILGYIGVMRPSSARLLMAAFREIRRRAYPSCKLLIIGNTKLAIEDFIAEDIRDHVVKTGWLAYDQINLHLAACDLLLLPLEKAVATNNVWPSKLNDYLSIGRPTVATDMRSIRPIFEQYGIGTLTEDNPMAFAGGCISLLGNESSRNTMGQNARKLAEGPLSWNSLVDQLETFYRDTIKAFQMK